MKPEILIIDEALAVGDSTFKQKCLALMDKLKRRGITMIFVSHSIGQIRQFCERTVWLDGGQVVEIGDTFKVTDDYLQRMEELSIENKTPASASTDAKTLSPVKIQDSITGTCFRFISSFCHDGMITYNRRYLSDITIEIAGASKGRLTLIPFNDVKLQISFKVASLLEKVKMNLLVYSANGRLTAQAPLHLDSRAAFDSFPVGNVVIDTRLKHLNFMTGEYYFLLSIYSGLLPIFQDVIGELRMLSHKKISLGNLVLDYESIIIKKHHAHFRKDATETSF